MNDSKPNYAAMRAALTGTAAPVTATLVRDMEQEPVIDPKVLADANARHDAEHGDPVQWQRGRVRSTWSSGKPRRKI